MMGDFGHLATSAASGPLRAPESDRARPADHGKALVFRANWSLRARFPPPRMSRRKRLVTEGLFLCPLRACSDSAHARHAVHQVPSTSNTLPAINRTIL